MRHALAGLALLLAMVGTMLATTWDAQARVVIQVDKSQQRMTVVVNGVPQHSWPVSTGRASFGTPSGTFAPQRLERMWFSRKYYDSPMPYSIFFHRGYAIHGSYEISKLGGPASHGCIRLHPQNAATLFALVRTAGASNTTIVVSGDSMMARRRAPVERYGRPTTTRSYAARSYDNRSYDKGWQDEESFSARRPRQRWQQPRMVYEDDDGWRYWGHNPRGWR